MQNTQQGKIIVKNPDMLLSWYGSIPYDEAKKPKTTLTNPSKTKSHSQKRQCQLLSDNTR